MNFSCSRKVQFRLWQQLCGGSERGSNGLIHPFCTPSTAKGTAHITTRCHSPPTPVGHWCGSPPGMAAVTSPSCRHRPRPVPWLQCQDTLHCDHPSPGISACVPLMAELKQTDGWRGPRVTRALGRGCFIPVPERLHTFLLWVFQCFS